MFELKCKTWLNEEEVRRKLAAATTARVAKCAALVEAEAKQALSQGAQKLGFRDTESGDLKRKRNKDGDAPSFAIYGKNETSQVKMRTGQLRSSIRYAKSGPESYVIGPTAKGWYGRVHEFGCVINVTSKMRGFLKWAFGWTVFRDRIHIPARPFMRPALDRAAAKFPDLFRDLLSGGNV